MEYIHIKQKLGEIISIFPDSARFFTKYKVDFCCGGHKSLEEALKEKGLDKEQFLNDLNEAYQQFISSNKEFIDWRQVNTLELIKHIICTHHDLTKKELREIDFYLFKILKVHFSHHGNELLKLHRLFGILKMELEEHLIKEEEHLFPIIEEYEEKRDKEILNLIHQYIEETENDHVVVGDILKEIELVTNDFKVPSDTCQTFNLVYSKLEVLKRDLFQHIHLENSVLFERF